MVAADKKRIKIYYVDAYSKKGDLQHEFSVDMKAFLFRYTPFSTNLLRKN